MPSMRVLITGAGGFVGRHLIAALAALPDAPEIVAGTYGEEASSLLNARAVSLDVTDAERTFAVIQAEQPTHVMHLAGISVISQANRDVRKTWEVNAQGTLNVALAIKAGAPACRLIFCSSAQVYGGSFRSGKPLAEDAPLDPENFYAASKAAADILVGQMAKDGIAGGPPAPIQSHRPRAAARHWPWRHSPRRSPRSNAASRSR